MSATLKRRDVVAALLRDRGELLVVAGLGSTAWDISAAGDSALSFPMWGAMGNAAMVGLGLALAQPSRRVLVITGDGEMLMGLGSLATIGVQQPRNLAIAVIDNERYGETGMQATRPRAWIWPAWRVPADSATRRWFRPRWSSPPPARRCWALPGRCSCRSRWWRRKFPWSCRRGTVAC